MSSAGRNQVFNDEQLRKIILYKNTDNMPKEIPNKENVHLKNTKTGTIKKTQVPNKYCCGCDVNNSFTAISRQPFSDIRDKNVDRNRHVPEEFKKADFVSGNLKLNKKSLPIIPKSRLSSTINAPSVKITETPTKNKSTGTNLTNKDEFWISFLVTNKTEVENDKPYMKVQKFAVKQNKTFQRTYSAVEDAIPSLRKKTLKKQLSQHSGFLGIVTLDPSANKVHPKILYSYEYMNDIMYNVITKHDLDIISTEVLEKNISFVDTRATVVNWLVKLHQYFHSTTDVFHMTVRLFDKILTLINVTQNNYQLVAIATYWIVQKFMNSPTHITGQKLLKLCNEAYTLKSLLEMEKNILMIIQFDVSVGEPTIFVYYFIYIMQLYESNLIAFCANYLLEMLTLDLSCNSFDLSLQAASAVYLSLKLFNIKDEVWEQVENYFGYHDLCDMFEVHKIMIKYLLIVSYEHYPNKESYIKYSSEKYGKVSLLIPKFLQLCYSEDDICQLTN